MTSKELKNKVNELYESFVESNGIEPVCAVCGICYLDDNSIFQDNISLMVSTPDGWDDDDIFFYVSSLSELCELAEDNGEDFIIVDILDLL